MTEPVTPPTPQEIENVLRDRGVLSSLSEASLELLDMLPNRIDSDIRRYYRLLQGDSPLLLLKVGQNMADVYQRHCAFAAALPGHVAPPAFLFEYSGVEIYGQQYIHGKTLHEILQNEPSDNDLHAFRELVEDLAGLGEPSTEAAALSELESFSQAVLRLGVFGPADLLFIEQELLPIVRSGLLSQPPVQRWSNGDFIASNILIDQNGKAWLIDCEFAKKTHFHQEDWLRFQALSFIPPAVKAEVSQRLPADRPWLGIYFWLHQIALEHSIYTCDQLAIDLDAVIPNLLSCYLSVQGKSSVLLRSIPKLEPRLAEAWQGVAELRADRDRVLGDAQAKAGHIVKLEARLAQSLKGIEELRDDRDRVVADAKFKMIHISGLETQLADAEKCIESFRLERERYWKLENEYAELALVVAQSRQQVEALQNSWSWRITRPLRRMCDWVNKFLNVFHPPRFTCGTLLFRGRRHRLGLIASNDIGPGSGGLEATAESCDPYYLLASSRGVLPSSWIRLTYTADWEETPLALRLYADDGMGFRESRTSQLPVATLKGRNVAYAHLPYPVLDLRLDPTDQEGRFTLRDVSAVELGYVWLFLAAFGRLLREVARNPGRGPSLLLHLVRTLLANDCQALIRFLNCGDMAPVVPWTTDMPYADWVEQYDTLDDGDRKAIGQRIEAMREPPAISVLMPVHDTPEEFLRRAIESVRNQLYPHWELCIADDNSTAPHVRPLLEWFAARDARIKLLFREENGHISRASNSALTLATAEWVAFMDHDDELREHALYMVAEEILSHPGSDLIYSDEDKIDDKGQPYEPHFKPDFSLDLLRSYNYICHLAVYRRCLLEELGGLRGGFEGSQDYDLVLRAVERSRPERIRHIPHVLYHWRSHSNSTAKSCQCKDYALRASRRALREHLERVGIDAELHVVEKAVGYCRVRYPLPATPPMLSVVIPTRNRGGMLRTFVDGILCDTDYSPLEVLILDNDSDEPETVNYLRDVVADERVRVIPVPGPFNYSAINNAGVRAARGELIALCNNDLQVMDRGWLREMASQAVRPEVGAVGAKLYYADGRIQHAGVILGTCGVAGHSHKYYPRDANGYFSRLKVHQNLSAVTAACLVMRREVFERVGGLNERELKVAFNDVDFCLRIRQAGYYLVWTPFAELYHLESASRGKEDSPEKQERFRQEINYMRKHWGGTLDNDPYYSPNLTLEHENFFLARPPRARRPWASAQAPTPAGDASVADRTQSRGDAGRRRARGGTE